MALWTFFGLARGRATSDWPEGDAQAAGQHGVQGMPRVTAQACAESCAACVAACPTDALHQVEVPGGADAAPRLGIALDYGRCIACQRCVEVCPVGTLQASHDWALAVRARADLRFDPQQGTPARDTLALELQNVIARRFRHSLHIRHVDAGSCNGCESELQALMNPFYNLHRLGIFFTASPRAADLLLVTGTVTEPMREPLRAAWEAMPEPKWVMAMGACAISGGMAREGYAGGSGLQGLIPVDVYLPGCAPNPAAIMHALLLLLGRSEQHLHGGRRDG
ncbi:MAG: NADH-quinone oxidoreductase subunit NuoB [Metallibacterium scheffleri]|jgi:Ni,Fe-hydrogenase III small subunit/Pyruvate/2-oxoacid:ferredoxin oxidoreductase delta subunit|uniref:NADH-quinone oxidoreductase subunit NuoB n=1 Tax=Metallibacterium scheffleri TaxID=993689 RepID=UPI0026EC1017|nr:NADH-quinone oxidoreductase subunit NuoB [Metallibacterium scheffleri]MCK9367388.1 NADH-quinone oxidoreductase subunit NuoB [Metallibacterium scheffleri]